MVQIVVYAYCDRTWMTGALQAKPLRAWQPPRPVAYRSPDAPPRALPPAPPARPLAAPFLALPSLVVQSLGAQHPFAQPRRAQLPAEPPLAVQPPGVRLPPAQLPYEQ